MSRKVLCPFHQDTVPSMHIYGEWAHCFVCSANVKTEKLGLKDVLPQFDKIAPKKVDDVKANIEYIESLPTKCIRGLELPYNDYGYYLVWPDKTYYKQRLWDLNRKDRYRAPRGVEPTLFRYPSISTQLVVVEGELNAMSLAEATDTTEAICSPGSAANFSRFIKTYLLYETILIIADKDAAGVVYGKELRDRLCFMKKHAELAVVEKDFNDVLQTQNAEAVQEAFQEAKRLAM